ncbi:MAG: hypothetical protein COV55_04310 [Candidatus Komeilibacteria bacterium CG11_big_fil_rev_8_21_14_0_20_36_20]|uniref:Glycosyl transferase family 1 n=2 Tax=Patescibacteria group TaxID=1783273 RepID=A0A2H0NDU0_9BACT|nr:MAG: hypothetical protein COV55_04310 [Candidatus Komeilibacteria bacterium CG11_big_fil_rev_8_21_14_0_20_36_20]PIR81467.1 MAG: hypothetical protein COU21_03540 [Candidatus Komeilibacteria bacterium CG10_big_fil_rev_8_21_14_0_10_36_65]PJC55668.1 MAG: hypothetical protein CO027_00895 [Candidatus Komeilibacteria bacterium CG_4_9_14_0_2_um_filter_36_13]
MATIGLEATRANKKHKTGTEWYAWHLLQQFKELANLHNNKFIVYYNQPLDQELSSVAANFYFKQLNWPFRKFWTHYRLVWELLWHPVDKFFASNAVPLFIRGEVILTVHDLGFLKNPELYHPLERIYQKISHWLAIKRANKIITISKTTKKDIIKYFPESKNKIKVIYLGYNQDEFKPTVKEDKQKIKNKYQLAEKFILYIGRLETKKNIQNLIKAYKLLLDKNYNLVLAGRPGNYGYDQILDLVKDHQDNIKILGYINQVDYPKLLAAADLFVFPSKFEGFGLPVLEAMASGVPVACSDIPVLHEIADQEVLFFNPDDSQDMAQKIQQLIEDKNLQSDLINKGLQKAHNFSWQKCAQQTLEYIDLPKPSEC